MCVCVSELRSCRSRRDGMATRTLGQRNVDATARGRWENIDLKLFNTFSPANTIGEGKRFGELSVCMCVCVSLPSAFPKSFPHGSFFAPHQGKSLHTPDPYFGAVAFDLSAFVSFLDGSAVDVCDHRSHGAARSPLLQHRWRRDLLQLVNVNAGTSRGA